MTKVLFVEDELILVETLPAVLQERYSELQVVGFTDLDAAVARLKQEEFDVVLLDISMPPTDTMNYDEVEYGRLTGIAVARTFKESRPNTPIVALTVVSDPALQRRILDAGVDYIINKPAEVDEIAQLLLKVAGSR
jgi:CheY-like chemotaxis protein